MEFVVQATGVAHNLAAHVSPPLTRLGYAAVGALGVAGLDVLWDGKISIIMMIIIKPNKTTYLFRILRGNDCAWC